MVTQHGNALGIQFVDTAGAFAAVAHQSGVLQNAQMLGYRWARDGHARGQFVHGAGGGAQHFEDGQAGGVAQGRETVLYVSVHLR